MLHFVKALYPQKAVPRRHLRKPIRMYIVICALSKFRCNMLFNRDNMKWPDIIKRHNIALIHVDDAVGPSCYF